MSKQIFLVLNLNGTQKQFFFRCLYFFTFYTLHKTNYLRKVILDLPFRNIINSRNMRHLNSTYYERDL